MNKSDYRPSSSGERTRQHQHRPRRGKANVAAAAAVCLIWCGTAQAYFAGGELWWSTHYQHCCDSWHPVLPAGKSGTRGPDQGHRYFAEFGDRLRYEVYGSTQTTKNSVQLAVGAYGYAWEGLNARVGVSAFVGISDLITASSTGLPLGTPVDARLHLYATYPGNADVPTTGSILGYDFELNSRQTTFYQVVDVPGYLTVGGSRSVGAHINTVGVGTNRLAHAVAYQANSTALAFFAIELLTPNVNIPNHEFNEAERARLEGIQDQNPVRPAEQDVTNDGQRQIIGSDREVIGGARYYSTTEPSGNLRRTQSFAMAASDDRLDVWGYEYEIKTGALFVSILLPDLGDGFYNVSMWGDSGWAEVGVDLAANTIVDLTQFGKTSGARRIRVTGIEPGAIPDGIGFVSGLTFSETGRVEWTQTSIPVPEPGTWALLAGGLLALACRRRAIRV